MNTTRTNNAALKAELEALPDYFGSLLEEEPVPLAEPVPAHLLRADLLEAPPVATEAPAAPIVEAPAPVEVPPTPPQPPAAEQEFPRPRERFSALVIEAGNLTLLAPLTALGGVAPLDSLEVRPTPNHSVWYLGIADSKLGRVQLVDLAAIVTPDDRDYEPDTARQVVFLAGSRFALACRAVHGTRVIDPDGLRWRGQRRRLPWLAGVEREHMATLLDLEALDRTLDAGDWEVAGGRNSSTGKSGR